MEGHPTAFTAPASARKTPSRRPADVERHSVWAAHRLPVARHALTIREPGHLLAATEAVATGGGRVWPAGRGLRGRYVRKITQFPKRNWPVP